MRTRQRASTLRERWRSRSLATVWTGDVGEWHAPAVDAVCEALTSRAGRTLSLAQSCQALGEQRALVGVPLDDARADLDVAAGLLDMRTRLRSRAVDSLTVGWATCTVDRLVASTMTDPLTDYATVSYLAARLDEVYAEARVSGEVVSDTHVIVVLATEPAADRLVAQTRMITMQSALRYAFIGGESLVAIGNSRGAALALRTEPRLSDSLAVLRSELRIAQAESRLPSTRVWLVTLPSSQHNIAATLRDLFV